MILFFTKGDFLMKVIVLSSKSYQSESNYGDCILLDTGKSLVIYDCGSTTHANRVLDYMIKHNYSSAQFILSHNDRDHFAGLPTLLKENKISAIYTTLLLQYVDQILDRIDDHRKTRESVKKQILNIYDNIAKLSGQPIYDIYNHKSQINLPSGIEIIGPSIEYMLDTVAKRLDGRESNTQDSETAINATSIQVKVSIDSTTTLLLCGDSSFASLENLIYDYDYIQLPHHGTADSAKKIFEKNDAATSIDSIRKIYLISDNTGNSNGGSDKLDIQGHQVKNTKFGDILIPEPNNTNFNLLPVTGCLGE